ncbi:MAG: CoB--CoM heterodisulfide reductase iron-sulfur subunit A family protein, partial [Deltaproteobacteria bacterium]|nr:CoB--CoM heterodisulfide reductase iron-sulfur subunit A family protein [Deltaproteobacteria bacterium]
MEDEKTTKGGLPVLVIGGGIGGIKAALDLAEAGRDVVLVDKAPAIGGLMTQLDRTFPTNNCDLCTFSPHLAESGRQLHIQLLPLTELADLKGSEGDFEAVLKTRPRFIDLEKCTACGDCLREFPQCVRFTPGLDHRAPTCMRYPRATPYAYSIEMENCADRNALAQVCQAGAILPEDSGKTHRLRVGSVVLAAGASLFDPSVLEPYGYGVYPNVLTALEYEQILSASGPTSGLLVRPSDRKQPRKIAWIQCVGSRSVKEPCVSYCSSACCMFALKEAVVTKERYLNEIETVIFYMDMRTSGKDYELYLNRAVGEFGVRLERARPHSVVPEPETGNLVITYLPEADSLPRSEVFDVVVLSTGFVASPDLIELAHKLG